MFIDTHAHLHDKAFGGRVAEVIGRAHEAGVSKIVNVGYDIESSRRSVDYARLYPEIYATVGIHPHSCFDLDIDSYQRLMTLAGHKKVVAVGEIGLDYYYIRRSSQFSKYPNRERQLAAFEQMLDLALELKLPVIIHSREAETDLLAILKTYKGMLRGVVHCFSGDYETAEEIIDLGLLISITGNITYKNNETLHLAVKKIPLDKIMLETDCPSLTPEPYRGQLNEPANIPIIAEAIAKIKEMTLDEVEETTSKTARSFFAI